MSCVTVLHRIRQCLFPSCSQVWGEPLKCHKNFGHSLPLHFNVFASPSKGWGLGKGTAFESPSPDSPVEIHSSFSLFPSFTIKCTVAPRPFAAQKKHGSSNVQEGERL